MFSVKIQLECNVPLTLRPTAIPKGILKLRGYIFEFVIQQN